MSASLDRDGWVVVPNALDEAWVARLRRAFESAPTQSDGTQHVRLSDDTRERASWDALALHPAIATAASHVLARAFRIRDLHGRNPLPGFGQQGLHTDWMPRAPHDPFFVLTAIWMFDDFTHENGATRVVSGSHRITQPIAKSLAQPLAVHPHQTIVTGRAGSVLLFNGHLWHSGTRNDTERPRRAAQMVMVAHAAHPRD
jgi:ectoine hydroxylase-related dioxygenase (phytanoyl-CoA dioxygenase family)